MLPIVVGGDHTVTLPILRALSKAGGPVAVVHFDAHLDTWEGYFGSSYTHGTWLRRAVEEDLIIANQTFQIGLRGQVYAEEDFEFSRAHGFQMFTIEDIKLNGVQRLVGELQNLRDTRVYSLIRYRLHRPGFRSRDRHSPDRRVG